MTSRTRQRLVGAGLLVMGLLVGGAIGALAGGATTDPVAEATTSTTSTTAPAVSVVAEYPTADPIPNRLPPITRQGEGPDPLLAVGLGTEEVIVRVTEQGPELLPVRAPGWVMGIGHAVAAYYDSSWLYLAPLDGGPVERHAVSGRPVVNDGSDLAWLTDVGSGLAVARVDLDDPQVQVDPAITGDLLGVGPEVLTTDDEGVVLWFPLQDGLVHVARDGVSVRLDATGQTVAAAPGFVATPGEDGATWFDRSTGEPGVGPLPPTDQCLWPDKFQGQTSVWWCTDGVIAVSPDWTWNDQAGATSIFDDGATLVFVDPNGFIRIVRPSDGSSMVLEVGNALVSAVRP